MYKYIILFLSLISLQSCGQNKKNMNENVQELWGNLYKDVKHYDQRINYHADILIGGCNFEVLINDFPVNQYFGPGNGAITTSIPINNAILNTGLQTWKIRVYPVHDKKQIDEKVTMVSRPLIQVGARVEINIEGVRFKENGNIEKSFGKVVNFEAPLKKDEKTGQNILADAGKPYVEYSGTFQADVPYSLQGWKNGEDLSKVDSSLLKQDLLKKYSEYRSFIQNRELGKIASGKLNAEKEMAQAFFYDKKSNEESISDFIEMWGQSNIKMYPLEKYTLKTYCDGKVVALERSDILGYPSLIGSYKIDEKNKSKWFYIYFYRPKGKKDLEVIR